MMLSEVTQLERVKPQIFVKKDEIKCYKMGCAGCLKGPLRVLKSPIKPTKSFRMSSVRHIFILCEVPPHPLSIPDIHRQLLRIVRYIRERVYHFAEGRVSGPNMVFAEFSGLNLVSEEVSSVNLVAEMSGLNLVTLQQRVVSLVSI